VTIDAALRAAGAQTGRPGTDAGRPRAALVTVAAASGSTPRGPGSRMLVLEGGGIVGTVGGGLPEARAIEAALRAIAEGAPATLVVEMTGAEARGSDLICGGSSEMWIEPLPDASRRAYAAAVAAIDRGERVVIVASPSKGIIAVEPAPEGSEEPVIDAEGLLRCPIRPAERLLVLGGGHVGLALARVASGLGFSVTVADPRPEFSDPSRFPEAARCLREDFVRAIGLFAPRASDYAVVVSPGHLGDLECTRALLGCELRYLGIIGSRRKAVMLIEALVEEGFDRGRVEAIRLPIGLDIGAETPEEIAVSIAAELVAVRRESASLAQADADRKVRRRVQASKLGGNA
jgi:xanthine dehydrogenase accessory factor